jgi:hypothetical protein
MTKSFSGEFLAAEEQDATCGSGESVAKALFQILLWSILILGKAFRTTTVTLFRHRHRISPALPQASRLQHSGKLKYIVIKGVLGIVCNIGT